MLPGSLRQKIALGFYVIGSLIVGLALLASADSLWIEAKILQGQKVSELFDAVLQTRRFEKNFLLYHERSDYLETLETLASARHIPRAAPEAFEPLASRARLGEFDAQATAYAEAFETYARRQAAGDPAVDKVQARIRSLGKELVSFAEGMAKAERDLLRSSVERQRHILLAAIVAITLLAVMVGQTLARRVTRALRQVEESTRAVAAGHLARIDLPGEDREIVAVAQAFNRMLDEIDLRQRQLVHTEKLASLGTLLSGVAHELNNPLSNISSSCQILVEELDNPAPEMLRSLLTQIDAQTVRARNIVRALLDFARKRDAVKLDQPLLPLLEEVLSFLRSDIPKGCELLLEVPADLSVFGDRQQLQQVLLNLLKNAAQAGGERGSIGIAARRHERAPPEACAAGRPTVEIAVTDNGPGIPDDIRSRIFDPFFTTKAIGKGTGLGLFVAHEIVAEHGGCITVDAPAGGGATFHVWLPVGQGGKA